MSLIAKDLPTLVFMLLPGFLAAGVFYTLTAHPKSSEFERLIQALIFTAILRASVIVIRGIAIWIGARSAVWGHWTEESELVWSVCLSIPLGIAFALAANTDSFHGFLRKRSVTSRTSYPSEWYSAFSRSERWIILHLADGRRLYGFPEEWPDQPDKGHFILAGMEWLLDDDMRVPVDRASRLMVPATDVKMVGFLLGNDEILTGTAEA